LPEGQHDLRLLPEKAFGQVRISTLQRALQQRRPIVAVDIIVFADRRVLQPARAQFVADR
jgi:hypothetical protein